MKKRFTEEQIIGQLCIRQHRGPQRASEARIHPCNRQSALRVHTGPVQHQHAIRILQAQWRAHRGLVDDAAPHPLRYARLGFCLQQPPLQPFTCLPHPIQADDALVCLDVEPLLALAHALESDLGIGFTHALVPGRLDIGGIHEARRVFIRLDAVDPVIADALDAASLAAGPIELVGEPDRRAPEGAPGEFALVADVCGIRVVVTPFVVLGRARLGITEQSDPRVSETPMAHAELIGAVAAIPGAGQLPGVIELLLVPDLVRLCPEARHRDPHATRVGQRDHHVVGPGIELQLVRQQRREFGIRFASVARSASTVPSRVDRASAAGRAATPRRSHPGGRGCGSARSCRRRGRAPP